MNIGQKLKARRKELSLTMLEVAKRVGVSEATVSRWESGDIANMRRDKIALLAKALCVTPAFVMDLEEAEENVENTFLSSPTITEDCTTFPIIGEVAAGYEHIAVEDWDGDCIEIPNNYLQGRDKTDFFVLRVKGNSMYPDYKEGDTVLILKQTTLNYSGQVGVVIYGDNNATLKKVEYKQGENWINLIAINPSIPPTRIEDEALEHCKILGIPKLIIREIKE